MALTQVGLERLDTATTKKIGTNKNLIINGAMEIAARGTSSTSTGYQTVDRVQFSKGGTDETPTQHKLMFQVEQHLTHQVSEKHTR